MALVAFEMEAMLRRCWIAAAFLLIHIHTTMTGVRIVELFVIDSPTRVITMATLF